MIIPFEQMAEDHRRDAWLMTAATRLRPSSNTGERLIYMGFRCTAINVDIKAWCDTLRWKYKKGS